MVLVYNSAKDVHLCAFVCSFVVICGAFLFQHWVLMCEQLIHSLKGPTLWCCLAVVPPVYSGWQCSPCILPCSLGRLASCLLSTSVNCSLLNDFPHLHLLCLCAWVCDVLNLCIHQSASCLTAFAFCPRANILDTVPVIWFDTGQEVAVAMLALCALHMCHMCYGISHSTTSQSALVLH